MSRRLPLAFLGIVLVQGGGCTTRINPEPIWIGHLAPFTGPDRPIGEQARQGIQLFIDQAVAQNLKVDGRSVAVVHVDGDSSPETVRAETARLLAVNRVAALIGSLDAGLAQQMVPEAQRFGARLVLTGEIVEPARSDSVVCLGVDAASRGRALAQLVQDQGWDRIAVVSDSKSILAGNLKSAFLREIRKNPAWAGIKIIAVTGHSSDEFDLASGPAGIDRWFYKPLNLSDLIHDLNLELHVPAARA